MDSRNDTAFLNMKFFQRKIKELPDEKLVELFRLKIDPNAEIIQLAIVEAKNRNLEITFPEISIDKQIEEDDKTQLKKWNWAAFFGFIFWVPANGLAWWWTVLFFIPPINFFVMFYLGVHGTRLAYEKSNITSVADFVKLQKMWRGVVLWRIGLTSGIIACIFWLIIQFFKQILKVNFY